MKEFWPSDETDRLSDTQLRALKDYEETIERSGWRPQTPPIRIRTVIFDFLRMIDAGLAVASGRTEGIGVGILLTILVGAIVIVAYLMMGVAH